MILRMLILSRTSTSGKFNIHSSISGSSNQLWNESVVSLSREVIVISKELLVLLRIQSIHQSRQVTWVEAAIIPHWDRVSCYRPQSSTHRVSTRYIVQKILVKIVTHLFMSSADASSQRFLPKILVSTRLSSSREPR